MSAAGETDTETMLATADGLETSGSETMREAYAQALLIRATEERLLELFAQGKLFGTVHTCIGQEWTGVAVARQLREGDFVFSNHRCHGHFLAHTDNVEGLIAEIMGKQSGVCGGRGGSQHLCAKGFFSNGVQGGIMPVAAGMALAQKLEGGRRITVVFIGDGTLGEGAVYETLNIASKWELPLLIVLENNQYAQSTSQQQTLAGSIRLRAEAFGIAARQSCTWSPEELLRAAAQCVDEVRGNGRPVFLQIDTYRLMAHSKGDDDRDRSEVSAYWARDPLTTFSQEHPALAEGILHAAEARIDAAVAAADAAPFAADSAASAGKAVYCQQVTWTPTRIARPERAATLIRDGLQRALECDCRVVLLGEDIESPYGGAFKATKGLSDLFPGRVRNTPISEALLVGLGNGAALAGSRPVCEIMFGDFITLCADQWINHASKFRYMYNGQVEVPFVLRTPMGGRRGYGPTHSQSLEKHFLGVFDTLVLALHHRFDPGKIYDRLFASLDRPTLVIENKLLYAVKVDDEMPSGFALEHSDERFPATRIRPEAPADVTIVCYGGMLKEVEGAIVRAFDEHEVVCEVVCPVQLYPLNAAPIIDSLAASRRLLVVEEGPGFAALGAEITAQVHELRPGMLLASRRVASPEHPIPSCAVLERALLPNADGIVRAAVELASHE
jgi:2-oxoisovalerate dehydrogenase E1 component